MKKLHVFFLLSLISTQMLADTALMTAVNNCRKESNSQESLDQLTAVLDQGFRFDEPDQLNNDMTPLYYAVMTRNEEVLELLLNNGQGNVDYKLNSNTGSRYTYTALMRAVEMRSEKMVQMLLAKGANSNTTSYADVIGGDGEEVAETTPLQWARAKLIHMKENAASEDEVATMERIIELLNLPPKIAA